jgi:hypothetical protein
MEMTDKHDPETLIRMLTEGKGIKINTIVERIGVKRTQMMSYRRSTKPGTKQMLYEKIVAAFPEYFEEGAAKSDMIEVNRDYFESLQKTIEKQEEQIAWLRKIIEKGK